MIDIELYNRKFFKQTPDKTLPHWERWVEIFEEMKIHTRGGSPGKLLNTQRPNEDSGVFDYRISIFQPITKSSINRSITRLFRIFLNSNFSYKVSDQLELYLKEKVFEKRGFFEYFHGIVIKRMIEDPNGFLAWLPSGEGLTEQTTKVLVLPEIIDSKKVWFVGMYGDPEDGGGEVLTWREDMSKQPEEFWSLTEKGYYRHVLQKDHYILELIYKHDLKVVPALVLGGIYESEGVLESYFNGFLPFGNEAIRQFSDCQAVNFTSAYPFRTEVHTECDYPQCQGRGWWDEKLKNGRTKTITCSVCHGTTYKPHTSPYGVFVKKEVGINEGPPSGPMIEFTSPATDILEYQRDTWQGLLELARKALFDEAIDEAQSGKAKLVDKEDEHAFYASISGNVYDHLMINSLKIINGYRDISSKEEVSITKPTSFVIKTETDLVNELGVLLEKNAPLPFILETVKDLAKKRFSSNKTSINVIDFLMVYDPLFALGPEEKNMLIATNVIDDQTRGKNINSYQVLMKLLVKYPDLFEGSFDSIEQKMDTEIDKLIVKSKVVYDANGEPIT